MNSRSALCVALLFVACCAGGCKSAYYSTLETFGKHKRDLLVDRVEAARDDQQAAKEEFKDALTRFSEVTHFQGGDLEKFQHQLAGELEDCESKAKDVHERIKSIETVARDLFAEWNEELDQYTSRELRRVSAKKLRDTQARYEQLIGAMKRAERKMQPVLGAFRDQVLFLKHNLNAQAIAALSNDVATLESDVGKLIADMNASIEEANAFIASMGSS